MEYPLEIGTDGLDIQTRVVLSNETRHALENPGKSGKVTLIGAFPTEDATIHTVRSYAEYLSVFKLKETEQEAQYDGHRAIKRIFMQGVDGYRGATQVTCVNINTAYSAENSLTVESLSNLETTISSLEEQVATMTEKLIRDKNRLNKLLNDQKERNLTDAERTELDLLINGNGKKTGNDIVLSVAEYETQLNTLSDQLNSYVQLRDYTKGTTYPVKIDAAKFLSFRKLKLALHKIADEDTDILFISSDLHECVINGKQYANDTAYDSTQAPNLGVVYKYLVDFINNEFTSHKPLTYMGAIRTAKLRQANVTGIPSTKISTSGGRETLDPSLKDTTYGISWADDYWGAKQIAQIFADEKNELTTCGLFYQGGSINHEVVSPMEMAAHICGWVACGNVGQDLTYQTIPGVTSIDEEVYFGKGDAGTLLNSCGVQVIRPKDRLEKTFYVNNSINPSGWHTNHVRSVIYLLKQYAYETGLGINNITSNVVAFRASLENVSQRVMDEVDLIRDVQLGDIEIINNYHLYLPIDIILAGVVTRISVGVSMTIDETGEAGSTQTTNGYNFYY